MLILTLIYGLSPQGCGTTQRVNEQPVTMKTYNSISYMCAYIQIRHLSKSSGTIHEATPAKTPSSCNHYINSHNKIIQH